MTVYFHVPSAPHKQVREVTRDQFDTFSRRRGCLVGRICGKDLFFWKLRHYESEGCSVHLTMAQAEQVVALMQKEQEQTGK